MKRILLALLAATSLGACTVVPTPEQSAKNIATSHTATVCRKIESNRLAYEYSPSSVGAATFAQNQDLYKSELAKRGFTSSEIRMILGGKIKLGMRVDAAKCAWPAELVSTSAGYGSYSEQWRSGSSYFYVNGSGRVDYYQS